MAVDDAGDHVREVGLGVDAVELAALDERGDDSPVLGAAVGAGEERILPCQSQRADGALNDIVVQLDAAVVEEQGKALPAREGVADRLGELGLLADQRQLRPQPWLEDVDDRPALLLRAARRSSGVRPRIVAST